MENKFYQEDDLREFLQESLIDFKMYPSRRVWHSLYRDMHPAQKWPSFAVCILLISAIMYIGVSNNNSVNKLTRSAYDVTDVAQTNPAPGAVSQRKNTISTTNPVFNATNDLFIAAGEQTIISIQQSTPDFTLSNVSPLLYTNTNSPIIDKSNADRDFPFNTGIAAHESEKLTLRETAIVQNLNDNKKQMSKVDSAQVIHPSIISTSNSNLSDGDKSNLAIIENFAFENKPKNRSFKSKASMQYNVTVAAGFRKLEQKTFPSLNSALTAPTPVANSASFAVIDIDNKLTQASALNIEAGTSLVYSLSARLSAKAGLQFNYTNYLTYAARLNHAKQTTILVLGNDDSYEEKPRTTRYANTTFQHDILLNNTTIQFSIPVGLDYTMAKMGRVQWNVAATLQPSLIAQGNVYALSTDNKNYITEPSLMKSFVLNTGAETYLSYKTNSGVKIMAGPQMRYQLSNTYKKAYNYNERLYNVGLKIGISKGL